jgi:hypothetical protein
MVEEEWKIGDEFIVIKTSNIGYLQEIGTKGKFYGQALGGFAGGVPSIYFTPEKNRAIRVDRIQKINSQKTYELW